MEAEEPIDKDAVNNLTENAFAIDAVRRVFVYSLRKLILSVSL